MRLALAASLLLGGALACSERTRSDEPPRLDEPQRLDAYPPGEQSPKSAFLARRLAEAADGYRDGQPKWVVADRQRKQGNHRVVGVFSSLARADSVADSVAKAEGGEFKAFGPFVTPKEGVDFPPEEAVAEVVVVYQNGKQQRYGADSIDALVWSLPAFDKFIVPYLSSAYSVDYAKQQRDLYVAGRSPFANSQQVAHKKGSF